MYPVTVGDNDLAVLSVSMTNTNTENLNLIQPHLPGHFSKSGINSKIILVSPDHWL